MERVSCLLCDSPDSRVRYRGRDRLHHTPGEFTLVECCRCGFLYLSPRPVGAELEPYYPRDYLPFRPAIHEERSPWRRFDRMVGLRKRCEVIRRQKASGTLLDVGCGTGDFLFAMAKNTGWQVRGLEPHPAAAARARASYGLTVDECSLEAAPYPAESFDVVTLWDVLEHLPWPRQALRRISELLRPGGLVVIGVPDRDSFDAKLFGPAWAGLDLPRHFSVFSAHHVARCLNEANFGPPTITNLNGGYHSFALSVRFWLDDATVPAVVRRVGLGVVDAFPFRVATLPYFVLVQRLRRGSTMIVTARKPAFGGTDGSG